MAMVVVVVFLLLLLLLSLPLLLEEGMNTTARAYFTSILFVLVAVAVFQFENTSTLSLPRLASLIFC
jgi:hypothetical protein